MEGRLPPAAAGRGQPRRTASRRGELAAAGWVACVADCCCIAALPTFVPGYSPPATANIICKPLQSSQCIFSLVNSIPGTIAPAMRRAWKLEKTKKSGGCMNMYVFFVICVLTNRNGNLENWLFVFPQITHYAKNRTCELHNTTRNSQSGVVLQCPIVHRNGQHNPIWTDAQTNYPLQLLAVGGGCWAAPLRRAGVGRLSAWSIAYPC